MFISTVKVEACVNISALKIREYLKRQVTDFSN